MKTVLALAIVCFLGVPAVADPTLSTGGPCASDPASRLPAGSRQILLSNPSKLYLAASLYREIDKPNFTFADVDGKERLSDFPYHYQVLIPPHGTAPVGCTRIFIVGGEASQTFFLEHADYFLDAQLNGAVEPRTFIGSIAAGNGSKLINLDATRVLHVTVDDAGGVKHLDLLPQAVSAATIGDPHPRLSDVHF